MEVVAVSGDSILNMPAITLPECYTDKLKVKLSYFAKCPRIQCAKKGK